jgi:NNP family nitrate/nitrite transporter-like MFS transporter
MGTCFGIVPYVDGPNTGTIAGIVGAGGNVGAVIFLNVFKSQGDSVAFTFMATFCLAAAFLTPLIVIKGYRGILLGKERKEQPAMLTVPVVLRGS